MRVFVYWNLHKKLWSIKALEGPDKGRVIARSSSVILTDAHGQVSEAGRQRVLREDRKNVHAGIVGDLVAVDGDAQTRWRTATTTFGEHFPVPRPVTYNPRKYTSFVYADDLTPLQLSDVVFLDHDRTVLAAA